MRDIFSRKMGICVVTGFSSGLPLYVLLSLLSAWLRSEGLDLSTIGFMSLVMFPYTWKFLWAPLLDRYRLFNLSRRKGWMLTTQALLIATIASFGFFDAQENIYIIASLAFLTSVFSATFDVAVDAYRREILSDLQLGLGNSLFVNAYRLSGLIPGGLSLILADGILAWQGVFLFTALCMAPGFLVCLLIKEPQAVNPPRTLYEATVLPFLEFIKRRGVKHALLILLFVFFYKLGDSMATALATPFYIDLGYDLTTIGIVAKNIGLWSTVIGSLLGGVIMTRIGINKALWLFGLVQMITIVGFWLLAYAGAEATPSVWLFALVLLGEYLGVGLGTAAFVSFIAVCTNPRFTALQFALLTSLSAIPRTFCNATTGFIVEAVGWEQFFIICTLLALPGLVLLHYVAPFGEKQN